MKNLLLIFNVLLLASCSPLVEFNQENRLKIAQSLINQKHELIVESFNAQSSSEAIIAADLYAIRKCAKLGKIPKIESRKITPKYESTNKKISQSYHCINGNEILKKRVAGLKNFHCRFNKKREELFSLCKTGDS